MGKKVDVFKVGDLVFAKVKGYPAWPAKIMNLTKSRKYSVYFYGTGETANVQSKDLYSYEKTKDTHATDKNLKKSNFREAMDQIEAAARGEDSAPLDYDIPADASTLDTTADDQLSNTMETATDADETGDVDDSYLTANETTAADESELAPKAPAVVENNILSSTPFQHVKEDSVDSKSDDSGVKSRSGRVIKKNNRFLQEEFEDSPAAPPKRKRTIESKVEKIDDSIIADSEKEDKSLVQRSDLLEIERNILQCDIEIKTALQLSSADASKCIHVLEIYRKQDITALMLKKNSNVVETIKRLRRYVGNIKDWNLTDEERIQFNEKAEKVRQLADALYNKFKKLFSFPSDLPFWTSFSKEVEHFKHQCKKYNISGEDLLILTEEPSEKVILNRASSIE